MRERRCEVTPLSVLQNRPKCVCYHRPAFVRSPLVLIAVLIIHAVAFGISVSESAQPAGDFDRYYEIASGAGRPYIDYQVEHPVGTLLVFKTLARLPGGRPSFGLGVVILDLIAGAIIVGSLLWGWGIVPATIYAAAVAPIVGLFFNRVDAWSTAAAILAVAAWRKNRPITLGCALAIGAAFKLWPLVLATLLVVPWRARRSVIALTAFTVHCGSLRGGRPLARGIERRAAGADVPRRDRLADRERDRQPDPPDGIGDDADWKAAHGGSAPISGAASIAMFAAAAPICVWSSWRGARLDRVGAGWLASVSTLLVLSALLSPQYLIWLAPAAGIAWVEGDTASRRDHRDRDPADADLLELLRERAQRRSPAMLTVVLRNAVLIALAVSAIARLRRQHDQDETAETAENAAIVLSAISAASAVPSGRARTACTDQTTGRHRKNQIASTA